MAPLGGFEVRWVETQLLNKFRQLGGGMVVGNLHWTTTFGWKRSATVRIWSFYIYISYYIECYCSQHCQHTYDTSVAKSKTSHKPPI